MTLTPEQTIANKIACDQYKTFTFSQFVRDKGAPSIEWHVHQMLRFLRQKQLMLVDIDFNQPPLPNEPGALVYTVKSTIENNYFAQSTYSS
jgi:hypothetical protein